MAKTSGGIRRGSTSASARRIVGFRETDKAVQVEYRYDMEYARSSAYASSMVRNRQGTEKVWIPKSQIENGSLSEWISGQKRDSVIDRGLYGNHIIDVSGRFYDATGREIPVKASSREQQWRAERDQRRQDNRARAQQNRADLIARARANGYRAHGRMKTRTLEAMAAGTYRGGRR